MGDELYMLPYEARAAKKELLRWIDKSHHTLDIAIYSFTNKEIAKRVKNAAKRGVRVTILTDQKQASDRFSQIGYLAKYRNIRIYVLRGKYSKRGEFYGKMHMKLAIFDNKKIVLGSANWTNSAFRRNYETLYFVEDYAKAKKAKRYFEAMVREAQEY